MAGSVNGRIATFCTIERDVGGGVMHPIFYCSFNAPTTGAQPEGCSPGLFGVDLTDPIGKSLRDQLLYADACGLACSVAGAGALVVGHPSERISNVYTET